MCGISGFADFNKATDRTILEKMNRMLTHRGPDGEGYYVNNHSKATIGLGHRRLSIIDLTENGKQPMSFDSLHITFNGEIYNYADIKEELIKKGHSFYSHSDTEVILHAYREWGSDAFEKFIGMFAIVLYDENSQKLFAIRDRAGVKPLFYFWKNGIFLFSSELKAILQHPEFSKEINMDAVAAYMQYGYVPAQHCIFKDTFKLKPGYFLELDLETQNINTKQYWNVYDAYNKPILNISLPDAIAETEKILTSAFQFRMVSDVPVGVFLSGGYDSSCVSALIQANSTDKLKTFTIGVPDLKLNEAPFAKKIANHLGTDHTEYYCTQKEAVEIIPQLPYFFDEPFADSSAIPTSLVSKIAREKVTVVLSADGGDEIFAGYSRYGTMLRYTQKMKSVPDLMGKGAFSLMNAIPSSSIPVLSKNYLFHGRYDKFKTLFKDPTGKSLFRAISQYLDEKSIRILFKHPVSNLETGFDSTELNPESYSLLNYMMAIDYQTYLVDDILQKVDRATMSVGLEGREPFLDHRVIEWAAQLPSEYKYNKGNKKFILKEIVHKYIPKEIMERPKMGFSIPINTWLQKDLKHFVDQFFDSEFIIKQNIFNNDEIQRIKEAFYKNNKKEGAGKIWFLLMFQMWYDKWINGN